LHISAYYPCCFYVVLHCGPANFEGATIEWAVNISRPRIILVVTTEGPVNILSFVKSGEGKDVDKDAFEIERGQWCVAARRIGAITSQNKKLMGQPKLSKI